MSPHFPTEVANRMWFCQSKSLEQPTRILLHIHLQKIRLRKKFKIDDWTARCLPEAGKGGACSNQHSDLGDHICACRGP